MCKDSVSGAQGTAGVVCFIVLSGRRDAARIDFITFGHNQDGPALQFSSCPVTQAQVFGQLLADRTTGDVKR
jgi:hypothetical protein